ncbi:MAG: hypothetical protein AAGB00_04715 [Planctomycetota bacterium]
MSHGTDHGAGAPRRSLRTRRGLLALGAVVAVASVGCTCSRRALDTSLKYVEAKAAYDHTCAPDLPHSFARHFERGWRCGYLTIAKGGDDCPPAVPPQQYWAHKYQSVEGRQFVVVWYDGWRAGAAAAKSYGVDLCHRVPAIDPCGTCGVRPDCDCRQACRFPTSGVLPEPTSVQHGMYGRTPGVTAPKRLPPIEDGAAIEAAPALPAEPTPSATAPAANAELLAPPPANASRAAE